MPRGFPRPVAPRQLTAPLLGLALVLAVSLGIDLWWLHHFRGGYPLDIDESRYLGLGASLSDALTTGGPSAFWNVWSAQHDFGPLLPLASVPVYVVFGHTVLGGLATQLVFFLVLVMSSYAIGARLTSRGGGLVVAVIVAGTPAVIDLTRTYQFAITDAAVLAAATYALLAAEAFTRRGWSLVWGLALGLLPLARTMAIAFIPAQLIAAAWLISVRPGLRGAERSALRGPQILNLALALILGVLTAATWLAESWHSVYGYLTNFGYGAQSAHFASSGSRLTMTYWTREAGNAVRQDLYLPLAALLAVALIVALAAALARVRRARAGDRGGERPGGRGGPIASALRGWAATDPAIVLFILVAGYLAVSSSRNEGVGFRVPLIPALVALTVAALFAVPWRIPRRLLLVGLVAVSAFNLVMKADLLSGLSGRVSARVPALGGVPVLAGRGYIQEYVLKSLALRPGPATHPLPASQRGWMRAYRHIVAAVFRLAGRGHYRPVVALATDEPLVNANDFTLAARLALRRDLDIGPLPGPRGPATAPAYERLIEAAAGRPNELITVTHVGLSYFALGGLRDVEQGVLEQAARRIGFACGAGVGLPDGRVAVVSWRAPRSRQLRRPASCAPAVTRTVPAAGATGVPGAGPISAIFSLPMRTSSLRRTFTLTDLATGRRIDGTVSLFGDIALAFRPRRPLAPATRFTATVAAAATAATGSPLNAPERWTFTTR